jgi:hypothetical protein
VQSGAAAYWDMGTTLDFAKPDVFCDQAGGKK